MKNKTSSIKKWLGRLADYCVLSFCFLMCCIPLVTLGTSAIALYDTVCHCFHDGEDDTARYFFRAFRQKLVRGILLTVLWGVIGFSLLIGYQIMCRLSETGSIWPVMSMVYFCTLFIPLGVLCWLAPVQVRFPCGFGALHQTAVRFAISYLPYTLAAAAVLIAAVIALATVPLLVLILPAAAAHLQSLFIEKALENHSPDGI